jgi:hypothetical protein
MGRKKKIEIDKETIDNLCECCNEEPGSDRTDHHGQHTGAWCDECYKHEYPYHKGGLDNPLDYTDED